MVKQLIRAILLCLIVTLPVMAQSDTLSNSSPDGTACRDFNTAIPAYEDPEYWRKNAEVELRDGNYTRVTENLQEVAENGFGEGYASFLVGCAYWGLGHAGTAEDFFLSAFASTEDTELETTIINIIGYVPSERPVVTAPETIDVSGDPASILKEIEASGLVPSGGDLVVSQDRLSLTTAGTSFDTYGIETGTKNYIFGATLELQSNSSQIEFCSIAGRVKREGRTGIANFTDTGYTQRTTVSLPNYVMFGFASDDSLIFVEQHPSYEEPVVDFIEDSVDASTSVQITIVVLDNIMNAYVNGDHVLMSKLSQQRGGWAFILQSAAGDTRCIATDFFAYQIPVHYTFGQCDIYAFGAVNRRSGPGTSFARDGQMATGDVIPAVGQAEDDAGFTWWQLENDAWVREDVVTAEGDCRTLPEVNV